MNGAVLLELVLVFASGAAAGYVWWRSPSRRARQALRRAEPTTLADARDGERARFTGTVRADVASETSPIGQRECIAFYTEIQEKTQSGAGTGWITLRARSRCVPFFLSDGTREALVDGPFQLVLDVDDVGEAWANLPPTFYAWLEEAKVSLTTAFGRDRELRFREAVLLAGDRVSVLGRRSVKPDPGGDRADPRAAPLLYQIGGTDDEPVVIADAEEDSAALRG